MENFHQIHLVNEACIVFGTTVSTLFIMWVVNRLNKQDKRLLSMVMEMHLAYNAMAYKQAVFIVYTMGEIKAGRELTESEQEIWHTARATINEYEELMKTYNNK